MVGEAVEHCGGHLGIAKDLAPPKGSRWSLLHAD